MRVRRIQDNGYCNALHEATQSFASAIAKLCKCQCNTIAWKATYFLRLNFRTREVKEVEYFINYNHRYLGKANTKKSLTLLKESGINNTLVEVYIEAIINIEAFIPLCEKNICLKSKIYII